MDFQDLLKLNVGDNVEVNFRNCKKAFRITGFYVLDKSKSFFTRCFESKSLDFISSAIQADRRQTIGAILDVSEIDCERYALKSHSNGGTHFSYLFIKGKI